MSLWCAGGMTAVELAARVSHKDVATTQQKTKQATLDRLVGQRKALPEFTMTTQDAVDTAKAAVTTATEQAQAERDRGGCKDICRKREDAERDARAALLKAQNNLAMTAKAAGLDAKVDAAQQDLDKVDLTAATKQADPQSENMAKTFNVSPESIALIGHIIFAVGVEIGSGLLPWLLFGHGKREDDVFLEPAGASTALVPTEPIPLIETPESVRERFFQEVVLPMPGQRVLATQTYNAYSRWCMERSLEPMSVHAFGTKAPWEKAKMGGNIWYLDARLAQAYAPQLRLAVSNSRIHNNAGAVGLPEAHTSG